MYIWKTVDLFDNKPSVPGDMAPPNSGWETSAASGQNVVIYTANFMAAYSTDSGDTFTSISPYELCKQAAVKAQVEDTFCCDQVVIYAPKINNFIWVLQTNKHSYFLAIATPEQIEASKGTEWHTLYLTPYNIVGGDRPGDSFDFPEIAVGDNFLYMTFDLQRKPSTMNTSIGMRFPLDAIAAGTLRGDHFATGPGTWGLRPAQNTGDTGYFVIKNTESELGVIAWPEEKGKPIRYFTKGINTCPTIDWIVKFPDGIWLHPDGKINARITGLTRTGHQLWVAWSAARKVKDASTDTNTFPYPHIGLAIIDINRPSHPLENQYIWNPEWAYAWPSLATNSNGDVGMSCWIGGNKRSPQYAVNIISEPDDSGSMRFQLQRWAMIGGSITTLGGGGHYDTIRQSYPDDWAFAASGFNAIKVGSGVDYVNHAYYVLFIRGPF